MSESTVKQVNVDFTGIFDLATLAPAPAQSPEQEKKIDDETEIGARALSDSGAYVRVRMVTPGKPPVISPLEPEILVIEDDVATATLIERVLTKHKFKVRRAHNRAEVIAALNDAMYDLVLLDIILPDTNGFDILARMRAHPRLSEVPVLMLTSLTDTDDVGKGLRLGVNGYLSKPVSPKILIDSIIECRGER